MSARYSLVAGISLLSAVANAQLVFMPDTNLRVLLNGLVPGAVDANGYVDPANPDVIATDSLYLFLPWVSCDLTGLSGFTELEYLTIQGSGSVVLQVSAWPDSLKFLMMFPQFSMTSLPVFPVGLTELYLNGIYGLSAIPPLPGGLVNLNLTYLPDLIATGSLPASLLTLQLSSLYSVDDIPNWPASPHSIYVFNVPGLTSLPLFPTEIDSALYLVDLPGVAYLPPFPASCRQIALTDLPLISILPELPQDLEQLSIVALANLPCLPWLPNTLSYLNVDQSGVSCLPNLPVACPVYYWNGFAEPPAVALLCTPINGICPPAAAGMSGIVYLDDNANGQRDPGEGPYPMANINLTPGTFMGGVPATGAFYYGVLPGSYTITCTSNYPYVQSISPSSHVANLSVITDVDSLNDFGVVFMPGMQDLSIYLSYAIPAVIGDTNTIWLSMANIGTMVISDTVFFTYDPVQSWTGASIVPDVQGTGTAAWAFTGLQPGETRWIGIQLYTPPGTAVGSVLVLNAVIDPVATDQTPLNNAMTITVNTVTSYDPNDKQVTPTAMTPAQVLAGDAMTYLVRFQNTGTWPAMRIVITDTLSSDLDWSSFQFIASSHACAWYVQDGVAHFEFDPIYLPDSTLNEPGSHGFVEFRIRPINTLPNGATVPNTANIYFDYNVPVITDPAVFMVDDATAVATTGAASLRLWPNPTTNELNVILPDVERMLTYQIVDLTGRAVLAARAEGPSFSVDARDLVSGCYTFTAIDPAGNRFAAPFVKR